MSQDFKEGYCDGHGQAIEINIIVNKATRLMSGCFFVAEKE